MRMMIKALREHWPEYLIEGCLLGIFMISAATFTALLEYPASLLVQALPDPFLRRMLTGIAMGATAIALIFSPWGKRSGAHMNPAVTLTFLRLGKVRPWDAAFYVAAQFLGAVLGLVLFSLAARDLLAHPTVHYVATLPGKSGAGAAFIAEFGIAFLLMSVVLLVSNTPRLARWTGVFAGCLVATYITFEAPLSGMSMNPARSFGSALVGALWIGLWIYFTAPVLAMLLAATIYRASGRAVYCAKLHHHNDARCIFRCAFRELLRQERERL
jgi:aquaporin Z